MKNMVKRTWVQVILAMLVTYCVVVAIVLISGGSLYIEALGAFIHPINWLGTDDAKVIFFATGLGGIIFLEIKYILKAIKNKSVDGLLAVLSCLIPILGIVLCVWNRCKKEKNIEASTAYFIFSTVLIVAFFAIVIVTAITGGSWDVPIMF